MLSATFYMVFLGLKLSTWKSNVLILQLHSNQAATPASAGHFIPRHPRHRLLCRWDQPVSTIFHSRYSFSTKDSIALESALA